MTTATLTDYNSFLLLNISDANPSSTELILTDAIVDLTPHIILARNEATRKLFYLVGGSSGSLEWISLSDPIAIATHISDANTNAATNAPTDLNTLTTLLETLVGEVNSTNEKQNDLAAKYNDLATKFNTLIDHLEAQGLQATS